MLNITQYITGLKKEKKILKLDNKLHDAHTRSAPIHVDHLFTVGNLRIINL